MKTARDSLVKLFNDEQAADNLLNYLWNEGFQVIPLFRVKNESSKILPKRIPAMDVGEQAGEGVSR